MTPNIRDTFKEQEMFGQALYEMEQLGISQEIRNYFYDGELMMSVYLNDVLDAVTQKPDDSLLQMVKDWENETGNLVYHLQKVETNLGTMVTCLFVSKHEEDWEYSVEKFEKDGVQHFNVMTYVFNLSEPEFSEYGSVGLVTSKMGGVKRIY